MAETLAPRTVDDIVFDIQAVGDRFINGSIGRIELERDLNRLYNELYQVAPPTRSNGTHCATCQCNKLNPEVPSADNPRSRSWHKGVPQKD